MKIQPASYEIENYFKNLAERYGVTLYFLTEEQYSDPKNNQAFWNISSPFCEDSIDKVSRDIMNRDTHQVSIYVEKNTNEYYDLQSPGDITYIPGG